MYVDLYICITLCAVYYLGFKISTSDHANYAILFQIPIHGLFVDHGLCEHPYNCRLICGERDVEKQQKQRQKERNNERTKARKKERKGQKAAARFARAAAGDVILAVAAVSCGAECR